MTTVNAQIGAAKARIIKEIEPMEFVHGTKDDIVYPYNNRFGGGVVPMNHQHKNYVLPGCKTTKDPDLAMKVARNIYQLRLNAEANGYKKARGIGF